MRHIFLKCTGEYAIITCVTIPFCFVLVIYVYIEMRNLFLYKCQEIHIIFDFIMYCTNTKLHCSVVLVFEHKIGVTINRLFSKHFKYKEIK